ncbi:general odorant-binding protein 28a-like [Teleopsis dalmanni]|uniref:general odorant-binding protein 28a-like n=1 Tax=Teleopsis dalmanni TaxID=139649 RepID=UPI0018CF231D|nr:general odorant-binding protein 28a-like [Teleopsis dalmanni]XP_037935906.1 general odorant-binding protein 28a-like [Teleopsis dalmanni]
MKLLSVLLLCSAVFYVRAQEFSKDKLLSIANDCKEETGASDDDVQEMLKHEPSGSTEAKCMRACLLKKVGIMDANGKLDKDVGAAVVKAKTHGDAGQEAIGIEIMDACASKMDSDDHCEAAEEFGACIKEQAKEKGFVMEE